MTYIHGYTGEEQDRLFRQSDFLESYIYNKIDFSNCNHSFKHGHQSKCTPIPAIG
jgi:hypothetical protein